MFPAMEKKEEKKPSDSEHEYQVDSGFDTTVNLNNNSGGNVFSALASGQVGMRTYDLGSNSLLPTISPLGSPMGGIVPTATKAKRSRNRAHKKRHKKSKSNKHS